MFRKLLLVLYFINLTSLAAFAQTYATFTVRVENTSTPTTLRPSDGSMQAVPLAPGVWAVHTMPAPLFADGTPDRGAGLEALAEDGNPAMLGDNLLDAAGVVAGSVFNTPLGATGPGALGPGDAYEFTFMARQGASLSFATMFVPSNDLFYGPGETGITLFDTGGTPISGDLTDQIQLWDAATEENEEPGVGPNQPQRQAAANTGNVDPSNLVRAVDDGFTYPEIADVIQVSISSVQATPFLVRLRNVSTDSTLRPSDGSKQPVPLAPGVWAVHTDSAPLFSVGEADRGDGLEALAEDGNPASLGASLSTNRAVLAGGVFNTPAGEAGPGPLLPGHAYEFIVHATPGQYLSLATMFVPSNDAFYAASEDGIALFESNDIPFAGDVSTELMLWDAGTEANEEPGVGPNQPQRQSGPNVGPGDSDSLVRLVNDGHTYPDVTQVINLTISPLPTHSFTVVVQNVSTATTLKPSDGSMQPVPLAPGVWALHLASDPLFTDGEADRGEGLEALAEDGNPAGLGASLSGNPAIMAGGVFNTPVGQAGPGPLLPGDSYEFTFETFAGARLSLATMFVPSNDLFYAPDGDGIDLFDGDGMPISGDVTDQIMLWDGGTEVNEEPGVGPNQPQRQAAANTGAADSNPAVRLVNDGLAYPQIIDVIRVSINPPPTSVGQAGGSAPKSFDLAQNYPNPFNPSTTISYTIKNAGRVKLTIYNSVGQRIRTLVDDHRDQGAYQISWNGRDDSGARVASGNYFFRLDAGGLNSVRAMTLVK